jgi:hypothetical protein
VLAEPAASAVPLPEWAQWVGALGPAVTLVAAAVAGWLAYASLIQRRRADAKAEWWRRTQWAFEQILADDFSRQDVGTAALVLLQGSELATKEDFALLVAGWDAVLHDVPGDGRGYEVAKDGGDV